MLRFLVLVLLAVAFWYLLDRLYRKALRALGLQELPRRDSRTTTGSRQRSAGGTQPEVLVRCTACGTYVPASRALSVGRGSALMACSEACRQRLRSGARR